MDLENHFVNIELWPVPPHPIFVTWGEIPPYDKILRASLYQSRLFHYHNQDFLFYIWKYLCNSSDNGVMVKPTIAYNLHLILTYFLR